MLHLVNESTQLPETARRAIADPSATIFVSVITVAELFIKAGKGRLNLPLPVAQSVGRAAELHRLTILPLDVTPSATAGQMPWIHSDPFDRLLIATALHRNLPIITSDRNFPDYPGVRVIWN